MWIAVTGIRINNYREEKTEIGRHIEDTEYREQGCKYSQVIM